MKTNLLMLTVFFGTLFLGSCKKDKAAETPVSTEVQIRVNNATGNTIYDCTVDPGDHSYNFGEISIEANSAYHTFPKAYRYAYLKLTMNNKPYALQPYDYVREKLLTSGKYTYKITYIPASDQLNLELVKD
jgi:hypothetical protein